MIKLGLSLKISIPKKQKTISKNTVKIEDKNKKGVVFIDENGEYKVSLFKDDDFYSSVSLIVPFTEKSYELKGKTSIFSRITDKDGRYIRYIRSEEKAKFFPGNPDVFVPFAPNWIVKGNLVREGLILKFDFISLVNIKGYNVMIHDDDE